MNNYTRACILVAGYAGRYFGADARNDSTGRVEWFVRLQGVSSAQIRSAVRDSAEVLDCEAGYSEVDRMHTLSREGITVHFGPAGG